MSTKICVFNPLTSLIDIVDGAASFVGSADAGTPVILNASGNIDPSFISASFQTSLTATAFTSLSTGVFVNLFYSAGVIYAQLADSSGNLAAVGFMTSNANMGDTVQVYFTGLVSVPASFGGGFSPSDTGVPVYLSTAGGITKTSPTPPHLIQQLGVVYQVNNTINGYVQFLFTSLPSFPVATDSSLGAVQPDGTTITISGGVISVPVMIGDTGSGGVAGLVPAPAAGTAAAGKFLKADGTWAVPLGGGNENANLVFAGPNSGPAAAPTFRALVSADLPTSHFFGEIPSGTAPTTTYTLSHTPLVVFGIFYNGQFLVPGSLSPPTNDYSISGTTITLNFTTSTESVVYAFYLY